MKIQDLPKHKRPREKLFERGAENLTDTELLAIIFRTGIQGKNALEIAEAVLKKHPLKQLLNCSYADLLAIKGIDQGKACALLAAFELGKRSVQSFDDSLPIIQSPQEALHHLSQMRAYSKEHFVVLYLNARNQLVYQETISIGTVSESLVHPREVFVPAITHLASSIIVAHNHPSGSLDPSTQDETITNRLVEAGKLLDIFLVDHLIITPKGWTSFRKRGLL